KSLGPYRIERTTSRGSDTLQVDGYGYPDDQVGLISSGFRPSDDATLLSFLIPSNLFAVVSLRHSASLLTEVAGEQALADEMLALAVEVESAIQHHGIIDHPAHGRIYAYEVDGFWSFITMDDANIPSLLSL